MQRLAPIGAGAAPLCQRHIGVGGPAPTTFDEVPLLSKLGGEEIQKDADPGAAAKVAVNEQPEAESQLGVGRVNANEAGVVIGTEAGEMCNADPYPHCLLKTAISAGALAAAIVFAVAGSATPARAGEVGLFGFYQVKDAGRYSEVLKALEGSLGGRGCAVRREGEIATTDGSLNVDKPNRFLLVECTGPLLDDSATRALFEPLQAVTSHLILAEGELQRFGDGFAAPGVGRQYIIKVSHYNNRNPEQRDRELAAIQQRVETRTDRYRNEAIITPSRALGMTTPDEVVVLYYDDAKGAERFRKASGDILETIGAFNEAHLVTFAYFAASSAR